jgi:hypothetical protein
VVRGGDGGGASLEYHERVLESAKFLDAGISLEVPARLSTERQGWQRFEGLGMEKEKKTPHKRVTTNDSAHGINISCSQAGERDNITDGSAVRPNSPANCWM